MKMILFTVLATLFALAGHAAAPFIEKLDLFNAGDTPAYKLYHIPGVVVTAKGTVLAWCEARKKRGDWDDIRILLRRSTDDGQTWSEPQSIADVPGPKVKNPLALRLTSVNTNDVTYNNPVLIADRDGTVHMVFCLEYMRAFYQRSRDEGVTWSQPVEITGTFEKFRAAYDWKVLATGPNHSIQLRTGRLIVPVWLSTGTGGNAHRPSVTATIYASILEPMTYLYRYTGDPKYLRFCEYVVSSFESATGPKLISTLTTGSKRVCDIEDTFANRAAREMKFGAANGQVRNRSKGYEMLSCIIGLARMHQLTGKPEYLAVAVNAWKDITENRLYLAGSSGADECFKDDHCLPAEASDGPAEGCVTAHWIYLSRVLFEITGEPRYVETLENALYNYLLASQRPQDCFQSYNTGMNGVKTFQKHDVRGAAGKAPCCLTSVMREIARTPEAIWTKFATGGLGVLLYTAGSMADTIHTKSGPLSVRVEMATAFPQSGNVTLRIHPQKPADFRLALRVPAWAKDFTAQIAGQKHTGTPGQCLNLEREWKDGVTVTITMDLNERLVPGGASYPGHFAFMRGPQVLTLVAGKGAEGKLATAQAKADSRPALATAAGFLPPGWIGGQAYTSPALAGADGCALIPLGGSSQAGVSRECRTWIPQQSGTGMAVPAAASELKATALSGNRIQLAWKGESHNAEGWRVERKRSDVGLWFHVKTTSPGGTSCVDDSVNVVTPGKTYM